MSATAAPTHTTASAKHYAIGIDEERDYYKEGVYDAENVSYIMPQRSWAAYGTAH